MGCFISLVKKKPYVSRMDLPSLTNSGQSFFNHLPIDGYIRTEFTQCLSIVLSAANVHFYDASNPIVLLGGLVQNASVTEANVLEMLSIVLVTESPLRVQERA